jgi:uncharacterized membrane protein YbhN (UPF0104 family)
MVKTVKRRRLGFLLKLVFSVSILVFLLTAKVSLRDVLRVLAGVHPGWIAIAFSLHAIGLLISAYRWQILARAQGDQVPLGFLARSYLVGQFFNAFLPTRFGGDVVRIWDGSRYSKSLLKSSAIVVVERLTGIIVLFLFALVASLFRIDMARRIPVVALALLLGCAGLLAIALFFTPFARRLLAALPERGAAGWVRDRALRFRETVLHYRERPGPFLAALGWAFLLQVNVVVYYILIGKAFRLAIRPLDYFIFVPIVLLVQILPISINGWGVREASYIEIFKFYGIGAGTAFSFSLVEVGIGLVVGAVGGVVYVLRK